MRIIAGSAKGRRIEVPKDGVRPTSDRVRETIFNVLGQWMEGERVLDLFAGTGALGIESLSRGAEKATFVEQDRDVFTMLVANLRATKFETKAAVLLRSVDKGLRQLAGKGETFTLVFADPPYARNGLVETLTALEELNLVAPGGRVVFEHDRKEASVPSVGHLVRVDERKFGITTVSMYERRQEAPATP